jgi:hypothetical protein
MSAMEISTAARESLPVKFFILDDEAYGIMQALQNLRTTATVLARLDYAALATALGVAYQEIRSTDDVEPCIRGALEMQGPVLTRVGAIRTNSRLGRSAPCGPEAGILSQGLKHTGRNNQVVGKRRRRISTYASGVLIIRFLDGGWFMSTRESKSGGSGWRISFNSFSSLLGIDEANHHALAQCLGVLGHRGDGGIIDVAVFQAADRGLVHASALC